MVNAATALAALLEAWTVDKNETPESTRGINTGDRRDFWRDQARAVDLARSVDNVLRGMAAAGSITSMYDKSVVSWYEAVFSYSVPWQQSNNSRRLIVEAARLENLQGLGVMLDQVGEVEISKSDEKNLRTTLEEAKELVASDPHLERESKRYIWSLIVEALGALDEMETFGTEPVRSILLELGGATSVQADVAAGHSDQERAGRWRAIMNSLVAGFSGGVGGELAEGAMNVGNKILESGAGG